MNHTVTLNDTVYTAPSAWNELSFKQLIVWGKICTKNISPDDGLRLATIFFYKIPKSKFFGLNAAQQIQLTQTLDFLTEANKLTNWLLPSVRISFNKYYGPAHRLTNVTIKEFRYTEFYYHAYSLSKDEKYLDCLIASLYRPKARKPSDNDLRVIITDILVQKNARHMARIKDSIRQAIFFNYQGCRTYIMQKFPLIFIAGDAEKPNGIPDLEGMIKTVAGGKFGAFKETELTPLSLFLRHVQDEIEEHERNKSK